MKKHTRAASPARSCKSNTPLLIFLDTEFTDLNSLYLPELISIGLVAEDGQTFYAELIEKTNTYECSDFTIAHVLPLLKGGKFLKPKQAVRKQIISWIDSFPRQIRIVAESEDYDWALLAELLSNTRPNNLHESMLHFSPSYFSECDKELGIEILRAQEKSLGGLPCHHALRDALKLKAAWEVVEKSNHPDFYKLEL